MWRSGVGIATKPREFAKSRTYRVWTKADSRPVKNSPRQIRVNYATSTQATTEPNFFPKYGSGTVLPTVNAKLLVRIRRVDSSSPRIALAIGWAEKAVENSPIGARTASGNSNSLR